MIPWQRTARMLTVAVAVTVSVTVFLTTHRRQPPPSRGSSRTKKPGTRGMSCSSLARTTARAALPRPFPSVR